MADLSPYPTSWAEYRNKSLPDNPPMPTNPVPLPAYASVPSHYAGPKLTATNHVIFTEPCPRCGKLAQWFGTLKDTSMGTTYTITHEGECNG